MTEPCEFSVEDNPRYVTRACTLDHGRCEKPQYEGPYQTGCPTYAARYFYQQLNQAKTSKKQTANQPQPTKILKVT